jgi:phosphatidylserine decarboxylase
VKRKIFSDYYGRKLNRASSLYRIDKFLSEYDLNMNHYVGPKDGYTHFNDFIYRKIKPGARPIAEGVVSPADGKLLVFQEINDCNDFFVKGSKFNLSSFMRDDELVKKFEGGSMLIVRLAPTDYHRYHFPASGPASESKLIKGPLFSVNPIALDKSLEIFCQNKRTICVQNSDTYGDILYSDVGATAVGTIHQTYTPNVPLEKGAEKGYFAFGGSTVVLFFEKGKIQFDQDLIDNTKNGIETAVEMGDTIAH